MTVTRIASSLVVLLVLSASHPASAQPPDLGLVSYSVSVPVTVNVPSTLGERHPPIPTWRSFVELDELRLQLSVQNESDTPLWIDRSELRKALRFRLDGDDPPTLAVRWTDEMLYQDRLPVSVPSNEVVLLDRQTLLFWWIVLRRTDGKPFGAGDHRIVMDRRNVRAAVRDGSATIWQGRVPDDATSHVILRVQFPTTKAETALHYLMEGQDRWSRDEFTTALNAFTRAAEANPEDLSGIHWMALMYASLNRYRDAIPLFEKVAVAWAGSPRSERLFFMLASAYLGAGMEPKAIEVLKGVGYPQDEFAERLQEARDRVKYEQTLFDRSLFGR